MVAVSGVILLVLGLFPKVGAVVAALPLPVLGGAGLALFGTVAASGIRSLAAVRYDGNSNLVIVALAIAMGLIPIAVPDFYHEFPDWFQTIFDSGISASAVTAVLLNIFFNVLGRKNQEAERRSSPSHPPSASPPRNNPADTSRTTRVSPNDRPIRPHHRPGRTTDPRTTRVVRSNRHAREMVQETHQCEQNRARRRDRRSARAKPRSPCSTVRRKGLIRVDGDAERPFTHRE